MKKQRRIAWNSRDDFQAYEDGTWDWVAGPVAVPDTGICDFPCKCVKINTGWLHIIIPAILRAGHADVWAGTKADKERAYNEINSLIGMIMACDCGDGGSKITTVYNQSEINKWIEIAQNRYNTYDYTLPSTIGDGNADPVTSVDPARTNDALCAVLHYVTELFRDIFREATETTNQQDGKLTTVAGYVGDVNEFILRTAVTYFGMGAISDEIVTQFSNQYGLRGLEYIARKIEGTTEVITSTDLGNAWVEEMACYLFENLSGETIDFDDWRQVAGNTQNITPIFEDHTPDIPTRDLAVDAWLHYINDVGTFFGIFEMVDDVVSQSIQTGTEIRCPCCNNINTAQLPEVFFSWNTVPVGWVGDNPFRHLVNFGVQVGTTGGGHPIIEFPLGFVNFKFSERIRVQRIRLGMCRPGGWGVGGNYGISASTQCFENVTDSWNEIAGFCDNGTQVDFPFPGPSGGFGAHETSYIFVKKGTEPNVPPLRIWGMWLRYEAIT